MTRLPLPSVLVASLLVSALPATAQPLPKHEFRGAWITTVNNRDWPTSPYFTSDQQKAMLEAQIDELHRAGINAVFFQVRPESDAVYDSPIEPWSMYLTGESGRAPSPYYDPLEFAIEQAHSRGMELHAWFNPFRAVLAVGSYDFDPSHVSVAHPEWLLQIACSGSNCANVRDLAILNPGVPAARDYVIGVIVDVVTRYDIDGVHFDDYFYPYPPHEIGDEDVATFLTYGSGFPSLSAWRLDNINTFVRDVREAVASVKVDMKFSISPFGIWRSGTPPGIIGLSGVDVTYADAPTWMANGWIDFLVPQLYWPFGGSTDYGTLASWWASVSAGRHIYPGHALYKAERSTYSGSLYSASEVPSQIRFNRSSGISGSVFFRARNLTDYSSQGFADSLSTDLFRYPALTPSFDWSEQVPPPAPTDVTGVWISDVELEVSWDTPFPGPFQSDSRRFAVYRVRSSGLPDFGVVMRNPANLLGLTGDTALSDSPPVAPEPYYYFVAGINVNSVESTPSGYVVFDGRAVPIEDEGALATGFVLRQSYPNPFADHTEIQFSIDRAAPVRLAVVDLLGRVVAVPINGAWYGAGTYSVAWDGTDSYGRPVAAATYFAVLESHGRRAVVPMVKVR